MKDNHRRHRLASSFWVRHDGRYVIEGTDRLRYTVEMATMGERWLSMRAAGQRVWSLLRDGAPGLVLAAGIVISALVGWLFASSLAIGIRYAGAVLQILGILLVAHGLNNTRAMFAQPTMTARMRAWLERLFAGGGSRNVVIVAGSGAITLSGSATIVAHGSVVGGSIERRLELLEADVVSLRKEMLETSGKTSETIAALKTEMSQKIQRLADSDTRVERMISEFAVGGLHLEWVGLCWLVLATIFGAFPDEIARLLS